MKKLRNVQRYAKISDKPFDQGSLIHQEAWFPPCFVRQNQPKEKTFFLAILDHIQTKMLKSETTYFHYFSSRIWNLNFFLDILLWEVGAKRHRLTDGQTDNSTYRKSIVGQISPSPPLPMVLCNSSSPGQLGLKGLFNSIREQLLSLNSCFRNINVLYRHTTLDF